MNSEPTYPADAIPGRIAPKETAAPAPAKSAAPAHTADASVESGTNWQKVGVRAAIGIGSAAVAAALLYANRSRKD